MSGLRDGFPRPNNGERAHLDGRCSAGSPGDNGVAGRGKAAQPNVPEGSGVVRIGTAQAGEQRRVLGIMAALFSGFLGAVRICSEGVFWVCRRCVCWLGTGKAVEEFGGLPLKLHNQPFRGSWALSLSVFTFACPAVRRGAWAWPWGCPRADRRNGQERLSQKSLEEPGSRARLS